VPYRFLHRAVLRKGLILREGRVDIIRSVTGIVRWAQQAVGGLGGQRRSTDRVSDDGAVLGATPRAQIRSHATNTGRAAASVGTSDVAHTTSGRVAAAAAAAAAALAAGIQGGG